MAAKMPSPAKTRPIKPAKEGQPSKTSTTRKRQSSARISAACEACKKRKTKCTGGPPPCQLCQSLGTECVIDLTLDMRRRAALQRTVDESKSFQDTLNKLIDCIRDESSPRFEILVEYVRGGASNQDVIDAVQHSYGTLEDDSDNISILHNGIQESQSPPSKLADDPSGLQHQITGDIVSSDKEKRMSEQIFTGSGNSSWFARSQELESVGDISALLSKLKILPTSDGERLLCQVLASNDGRVQYNAGYTAAQHALDGFSRSAVAPSSAERSMWHPALHLHSESAWSQEQRQHGENGPFQRRFSDLAPVAGHLELSSSANSSSLQSPASHAGPLPPPNASHPWPSSFRSPISPYVEFTGVSPSIYPVTYAWDLSIAQEAQMTRLRIPIHLVLPLIIPDDSLLSNMYSNYVEGARHLLETGRPLSEVLGTGDDVSLELFFRPRTETDKFDCASWACEVCRALAVLDDSVRIATAYLLTCMMRWLLAPTQANYTKLPDIMKPTPSQRMIPHIGAIEMLPLGPLRDSLIYHMRDWLSFVSKDTWSINWPFDQNAAIEQDPVTNTRRLTPQFIEHIRNYENWSVSRQFLQAFPELTGRIRVHD